jgi:competence protein ComEC
MNFKLETPFLRITLFFALGIIFEIFVGVPSPILIFSLVILGLALLALQFFHKLILYFDTEFTGSILVWAFLFFAGSATTKINTLANYPNSVNNILVSAEPVGFFGTLNESPVAKEKSVKAEVLLKGFRLSDGSTDNKIIGKVNLYFRQSEATEFLQFGTNIYFENTLKKALPPSNPEEFNYARYLSFHNIHFQGFVDSTQWVLISGEPNASPRGWMNSLREKLLLTFDIWGFRADEKAVASALILGYKQFIDFELSQSYSSTGAMHVLAVSGLHVGIIYGGIIWFLSHLNPSRFNQYLKAILALMALWFYASITGMSPSVQRAATMFSFVIIGQLLYRNTNIYNTIFASAFLLLAVNPYIITQVGFQLSYLAVLGIIYFQPKIYGLLYVKQPILDKVWAITAVSVAAQLGTFPVGLLYFHQFPSYFLISNLVVIPGAFCILILGLITLFCYPVPFIQEYPAIALKYLIRAMNWTIKQIEVWPYSLIEGINISILETYTIYFLIAILGVMWVHFEKNRWIYLFSSVAILLLGYRVYDKYKHFSAVTLNVYKVPFQNTFELVKQNKAFIVAEDNLQNDFSKYRFHLSNFHAMQKINEKFWVNQSHLDSLYFTPDLQQFTQFGVLIYRNETIEKIEINGQVKFLILAEKGIKYQNFKNHLLQINPGLVIIPSGVYAKTENKIIEILEALEIPYHSVSTEGFLSVKLNGDSKI